MLTTLLVTGLLSAIIIRHFLLLKKYDWLSQFDGSLLPLPIVGDAWRLVGHPSVLGTTLRKDIKTYGTKTFKWWFMENPTLITIDTNLVKELLGSKKHVEKHWIYEYSIKPLFGDYGLLASAVHQWTPDRKIWNKMFNQLYCESSYKLSVSLWKDLSEALIQSEGKPIKCLPFFRKHFVQTLIKTPSLDGGVISGQDLAQLNVAFESGTELMNKRMREPWTRNRLVWKFSGDEKRLQKVHNILEPIFKSLFNNLVGKRENNTLSKTIVRSDGISTVELLNPIEELITDPTKSWEWKYNHLFMVVAAGTDTATITATMTLFFLALNPECYQKAQNEVDLAFESNPDLEVCDLTKLRYLKMCTREAMRLHTPVPAIGRTTSEDIVLEDARRIPKGTGILIGVEAMHINPEYFPDPEKFDPERFNETNCSSIRPFSYLPFSHGPRNCIGQKHSDFVLLPALALTLRHFSVSTSQKAKDIQPLYELVGTPYPDVEITFTRRIH